VKKDHHRYESCGSNWEVEVETPTPGDEVCEDAAEERAGGCAYAEPGFVSSIPHLFPKIE
jgi:hypothetical protein